MGKKIFSIIILLLIAYGIWSFVNILGVKIRYDKLHEQTKNIVKFRAIEEDSKIKRRLKANAEESGLTLTDDDIKITHQDNEISISISYADSAVLPFGLKTLYYNQKIEVSKEDTQ